MSPRWHALIVLTAARAAMGFQFQSLASVAAPMSAELSLSYADLGLLVGLYFLPGLALALPGAALGRRFGDTRMVLLGLLLMLAGGLLTGLAEGHATLASGRLLSGTGAVLLNVLMAKMVTDWFTGQEIVLAMAVFVNSFPIGVGLALLTLGTVAEAIGWRGGLAGSALLAGFALLLMLLAYRRHPNDGTGAAAPRGGLAPRELALVCLAGAIWGIFNGAFGITVAFAPAFLQETGRSAAQAGLVVGLVAWLLVASVQAGGFLGQRLRRPGLLMLIGILPWGLGLLLIRWLDPVAVLLVAGLLQGLPVGLVMAMPSRAMRPEGRALGMGVFYTWLYLGHAGLPPLAGLARDVSGAPAAALLMAGAAVLCILPLYAAYQALLRRPQPGTA